MPVAIDPQTHNYFSKFGAVVGLVEAVVPAAVLLLLGMIPVLIRPSRAARTVSIVLLSLFALTLWMVDFVELFIGLALKCRLNDAVLVLVLQSDPDEASEFVHYALGLRAFRGALAVSALPFFVAAFAAVMCRVINKLPPCVSRRKLCASIAILLLLASSVTIVWAHFPVIRHQDLVGQSFMLTPGQLAYATRSLDNVSRIRTNIAEANRNATVTVDGEHQPLIVLVIGESDNKRHSPLYGYRLNTMPKLTALADEHSDETGRLIVFTDVVTGECTTRDVMQRLMSTNMPSVEWENRPLLAAVLRKAGYKVGYFDNQSTASTCANVDYSSVFFFNDTTVSSQCFDARNLTREKYDGDFVARYLPEALSVGEPAVVIFHLMGQHIRAEERYGADRALFTLDDYEAADTLSVAERTDIMHYDNATVHLDMCLSDIISAVHDRNAIVVYVSDHSEEIYDYRRQYGRTQEPMTPMRARALYEVPMYVYMTPEAIESRPDLLATLQSRASTRMHTFRIPDLVLDLANVRGAVSDRRNSIAADNYDSIAPRLLFHGEYDYDKICNN